MSESAGPVEFDGAALIERVRAAGLRGRGGGWFPAARKWQAVRAESADSGIGPVVVGNGAEGEPGSIKDRAVMMTRAVDVIEGLRLAARAVGAREAVLYLKGSFMGPAEKLSSALREAELEDLRVTVTRGEDGYIAGEETAILETLEGRRAWPRAKPPLPATVGLRGGPTLVQNVETLSRVPAAVADPEGFRATETTLVSLWGHVRRPGVYEVRLGTPLHRFIGEQGQGALDGLGMIFPAGPSAAPLSETQADTPLDPDVLRSAGSGLGTAAVLVIGKSACPLAVGASLAGFFERESCGQCPPCTMGTANLARVLRAVEAGNARPRDLQDLAEAAGFMSVHGYCAHSRTAAASITGLLANFRHDVLAHLAARGCPRPTGGCDPFGPRSPERAAIELSLERLAPAGPEKQ